MLQTHASRYWSLPVTYVGRLRIVSLINVLFTGRLHRDGGPPCVRRCGDFTRRCSGTYRPDSSIGGETLSRCGGHPPMRSETFHATVRDDGWFEVSGAFEDEWVAVESPVEVRE